MIMEFTRADNNKPIYVNMDHVTDFYEEANGTRLRYQGGGAVVVTGNTAKIFQDYCSQKMACR